MSVSSIPPAFAAPIVLPPSIIFSAPAPQIALRDIEPWDRVAIGDLRPTQMAVGLRAVEAKRAKIQRHVHTKRRMRRFLDRRPVPVVLGPDDDYYMIDHHHLCLALLQTGINKVFVRVVSDFSDMPQHKFLRAMSAMGWLHAFDTQGQRICPTRLPVSIDRLRFDPYRDLAWCVRQSGGFRKIDIPFVEFGWANFFRANIPERQLKRDFEGAFKRAMLLARSNAARSLPGFHPAS